MPFATREQWLQRAVRDFRPYFATHGATLPEVQVACGFPSTGSRGKRKRTVGECHDATMAKDQKPHILVSPLLDNPAEVLATLLHECVHAAVGNAAGHGPVYRALAERVGLEGRMTSTKPGAALTARLSVLAEALGPYPHGAIDLSTRKKQGTRLLKAQCPECGAIVRLSAKVAAAGMPYCGCEGEPVVRFSEGIVPRFVLAGSPVSEPATV